MTIVAPVDGDLTDPAWAQEVTDALNTFVVPISVIKAANTARNNTSTPTDDPELTVTLTPGVWEVRAFMVVTSAANAAGDFQGRFTFPSGWEVHNGAWGLTDSLASGSEGSVNFPGTSSDTATPTSARVFGASTTGTSNAFWCIVEVDAEGAFTFQWAQASSNANNTTVFIGSSIVARRLS